MHLTGSFRGPMGSRCSVSATLCRGEVHPHPVHVSSFLGISNSFGDIYLGVKNTGQHSQCCGSPQVKNRHCYPQKPSLVCRPGVFQRKEGN
jgi:hypothetical protein